MAEAKVFIPDGKFCSDKNYLGCLFESHKPGFHRCMLYQESLQPIKEFKINGEIRRAFLKCEECLKNMENDSGNGFIVDPD